MLHSPTNRRERILLYGPSGSGKSTSWLNLAEWLNKTHSTAHIHAGDTDRTWDDMAPYDGHLDKTVTVHDWPGWQEIRETIRALEGTGNVDDWLVIDMISRCWDRVQENYFEKAFGKDLDEFFTLGSQADRAKLISGDYGTNWQAINKMYATLTTLIMTRWPGHVLCCTPAQKLWEANTTQDTLVQYPEFGKIGYKPQGQKDLSHMFRTILFLQQSPGGWLWSTAKERNPPGMKEGDEGYRMYGRGEGMGDFVKDYLFRVAKWKP